jgi:PKD repeat protein
LTELGSSAHDAEVLRDSRSCRRKGTAGLFSGVKAGDGINPSSPGGTGWADTTVLADMIALAPKNEACSVCHFFDNSFTAKGPAGKPMGNTAWQKKIAANSFPDGDIGPSHPSYNGGNNIVDWVVAKGKPEGGKRAESINDPNNPDAHMDATAGAMTCSMCHYNLAGTYGALMHGENVIYPEITVQKIDHQFAKGDNLPDGKNMDQLDSTVTCASCHTERTHPNNAGAPTPAHAGFPAVHFEKLDCRVCHVPVMNAKSIWKVADFTVGPFRTFERNQAPESALGSNAKPLYIWRQASTSDTIKMEPVNTTVVPVWTDNSPLKPTYQRVAKGAAEAKRAMDGYNASGVANFSLNQPQGGDTTLIVNTKAEITDMVSRINSGAGITTAVMNFYINTFDISHNIMPKGGKCIDRNADGDTADAGECNYILGATEGGGCVMCHSSSGQPNSVGFFDKTHTLFANPTEDDTACGTTGGIVQTTINNGTSDVKRVAVKFSTIKSDGTPNTIDLSNVADCTPVGNTLNQGEVLGYDSAKLAGLTDLTNCAACHTMTMATLNHPTGAATPATCTTCHTTQHQSALNVDVACGQCHGGSGAAQPGIVQFTTSQLSVLATNMHGSASRTASFTWALGAADKEVVFDASATDCDPVTTGVQACASYSWNFGDGTTGTGVTTSHTYASAGNYLAVLTVTDGLGNVTLSPITSVAAVSTNTPPTASKSAPVVTGMTVSVTDTSTDAQDAQGALAVTVNCGNGTIATGAGGSTLVCTYTSTGTYTIRHSVKDTGGKGSLSAPVSVNVNATKYRVSGTITKQDGTPIPYATLKLKLGGVIKYSGTSSSTGTFAFGAVLPGSYTVTATKTGLTFADPAATVDVVAAPVAGVVVKSNE